MFTNDKYKECKDGIVEIPCNSDAVKQLISFTHTGQKPIFKNYQMIEDILNLSEKYQIIDLKTVCLCHLQNEIIVENVLQSMILAERYKSETLFNKAMEFVINNIRDVVNNESYKKLPNQYYGLSWKILGKIMEN